MLAFSRTRKTSLFIRAFSTNYIPSSENAPEAKSNIYQKNQVAAYKANPAVSLVIRSTSAQELNNQSEKEKF